MLIEQEVTPSLNVVVAFNVEILLPLVVIVIVEVPTSSVVNVAVNVAVVVVGNNDGSMMTSLTATMRRYDTIRYVVAVITTSNK